MFERRLQDMSWRRLQDMSLRRLQDMPSRCLEGVFSVTIVRLSCKTSCEMSSRRLQNVFARRLPDVLEDQKFLRWRRVECVFKTCFEEVFKTSSRPTNVCWVKTVLINRIDKDNLHYWDGDSAETFSLVACLAKVLGIGSLTLIFYAN